MSLSEIRSSFKPLLGHWNFNFDCSSMKGRFVDKRNWNNQSINKINNSSIISRLPQVWGYQHRWTPVLGQQPVCRREDNPNYHFVVKWWRFIWFIIKRNYFTENLSRLPINPWKVQNFYNSNNLQYVVITLSRMPIKDMLSKLSKRFGKVLNHACILLRNLRETTLANTELLHV